MRDKTFELEDKKITQITESDGIGQLTESKTHRHRWEDHCDCEYCLLKMCLKCGQEASKLA